MSTILIILFLVVAIFVAASLALGRTTQEVESARDTEYVDLEGQWIRYDVIGGGPPVLLVHGWLSSSRVWDQLAGRLAQRFTVYTLDLTGFGESDKPLSGYGIRYGSRLLYAFCAHFGITRASVIGHDLGGDMAVKLAADHPDVVGRLVLVATPADEDQIDLPTPLWLATLPVAGPIFYTLGRLLEPVRRFWMRPFVLDPADLTDETVEDAAMSTPAAVSKTLRTSQREISGGRLTRQARGLNVPILCIAGEEDQIVDPQAVADWGRSATQAEICLIDDCGHMPMDERTAEFNARILAFLTGDARYLDYAGGPSEKEEAGEYEEGYGYASAEEEPDEAGLPQDEDAPYSRPAEERAEDAMEPGSERWSGEPELEHKEPGDRSPEPEPPAADVSWDREERESAPPGGETGEPPPGDRDTGERRGNIPGVPDDLFSWPDPGAGSRSRERRRERQFEEDEEESDPDNQEEPPRF